MLKRYIFAMVFLKMILWLSVVSEASGRECLPKGRALNLATTFASQAGAGHSFSYITDIVGTTLG